MTRKNKTVTVRGHSAAQLIAEHYASLSEGHQRVADFILSSPHEAAMMTLQALASATQVSEATVNRLGGKLGLSGHPELKNLLRLDLREALRPIENFTDMLREPATEKLAPWAESIQEDLWRIRNIRPLGGDGCFAKCSKLIAKARNVYIVGFGSSAFIAQYGVFCLSALRGNCIAVADSSGIEGAERALLDVGPEDVAIQIAFARYSMPAITLARRLHEAKTPLICITDGEDSPFIPYAANAFIVERKSGFVLTGAGAGAVAVIEALLRGTAAALGHEAVSRRSGRLTSLLDTAVIPPRRD